MHAHTEQADASRPRRVGAALQPAAAVLSMSAMHTRNPTGFFWYYAFPMPPAEEGARST